MVKNVLIGCERSQVVCDAFLKRGYNAYSNDLKDCYGEHPQFHLKMDVFAAINIMKWDLIIIHPPCTCIAVSGNATYAYGKPKFTERLKAVKFTKMLWDYAVNKCDKVAMENPVGCLNTYEDFPKPQYIEPYMFGHKETKKTGLWLYNLPYLNYTRIVEPEYIIAKNGDRYSRIHYLSQYSSEKYYGMDRSTVRSKTYPGIAEAMVNQWGRLL